MARVVQRRSTPPYLVIVFVLLFLVSTALAVIWNIDKGEKASENIKIMKRNSALASEQEFKSPKIQDMIKTSPIRGARRQTVIGQFINREAEFSSIITGRQDVSLKTIKAEEERVRQLLGATDSRRGLLAELERLQKKLDIEAANVKNRDAQLLDKDAELANMAMQLGKRDEAKAAKVAELLARVKAAENQLNEEQREHVAQRLRDKAASDDRIAQREKTIAKINEENQKLQIKNQRLDTIIANLKSRIEELEVINRPGIDPAIAKKGAGKIIGDMMPDNRCFVNIGRRDGVKPGITFAIYQSGAIAKGAKPKGALVVTKVYELISECRITRVGKNLVIGANDTIANLAFDTKRTYVFVVAGEFDLHGTGKATLAGTEEVAMLIRTYGGKIVRDVDIKTDYVVLGEEMPKPAEPGPDAPAQVRAAYRQQMIIYNRFQTVKRKAIELRIPTLNTNRFMDYIGKIPTKTLIYE